MTTPLTSRERVARAFRREPIDRVPRIDNPWPDTIRLWQQQGYLPCGDGESGARAFDDAFGSDFQRLTFFWTRPFPDQITVLAETDSYRDVRNAFGSTSREWKNKSGVPGHSGWECDSPEIWHQRYRPAFEQQPVSINIAQMRQRSLLAHENGRWRNIGVPEVFEVLRQMIGDELFLISLLEEPEWIVDMARVITDCTLRNLDAAVATGMELDGLWIYGDMAFKTGPFCSPTCYRDLIKPQHRRLADWAHQHGVPAIYHSDGDIRLCLDDLLDAGFDALHPLERNAGMDLAELAPRVGHRALLIGNVSVPVLLGGDPDAVETELLRCLRPGMDHGCYVYHSDHSLPPEVRWTTILQVKSLLDHHGVYA